MDIADSEAALSALREFRELLEAGYGDGKASARAVEMQPTIEEIAKRIDPDNVGQLSERTRYGGWDYGPASTETLRLIGILQSHEVHEQIFGPVGPSLAANRLHPWVWEAAASLWDGGHYDSAVHAACKAVERHTQLSIGRLDLDGKALYGQAFSTKDPKPGEERLRFPDIDREAEPKRWISAHEGAQYFGMGCAQGIRNPQAHPSPDLTEQEALEQLAALSVLARWVEQCKPDPAAPDGAASDE